MISIKDIEPNLGGGHRISEIRQGGLVEAFWFVGFVNGRDNLETTALSTVKYALLVSVRLVRCIEMASNTCKSQVHLAGKKELVDGISSLLPCRMCSFMCLIIIACMFACFCVLWRDNIDYRNTCERQFHLEEWNRKNPDHAIQVNDILISVTLGRKHLSFILWSILICLDQVYHFVVMK